SRFRKWAMRVPDSVMSSAIVLLSIGFVWAFPPAIARQPEIAPVPAVPRLENDFTEIIAEQTGWDDQFRTPDGSYVDLLTPTHAIEVDFPHKWAEAVGQSLFYAAVTERQPGILLLDKGE